MNFRKPEELPKRPPEKEGLQLGTTGEVQSHTQFPWMGGHAIVTLSLDMQRSGLGDMKEAHTVSV